MNNTQANELLGRPHWELVDRYGYHETLLGRYATEQAAKEARQQRTEMLFGCDPYGHLVIRRRAY